VDRNLLFAGIAGLALSSCVPSLQERPAALPPQEPSAVPPAPEPAAWVSPEAADLDPAALRRLVEGAKESGADGLVVVKDGRLVLEEHFGTPDGPIEAWSATKSVVSLAVGLLLDEGRLKSVDQPVSDFYPEWRQGKKAQVTLRHLLNQTSGLGNVPPVSDADSDRFDWVQVALAADLASDPGSAWAYNNKAVNLIAGIVKKASGQRLDQYLRDRLFSPLGIKDYAWRLDKVGNPLCMAGLQIRPRDLARIGELLADGGLWRGRRIVSAAWIEASALEQSQQLNPGYGLLWWLIGGKVEVEALIDEEGLAKLRKAGVDHEFIEKAATLKDRRFENERDAAALMKQVFGPDGVNRWTQEVIRRRIWPKYRRLSPPTAFEARGYLGQYLRVSPRDRLVVACMHRAARKGVGFDADRLAFPAFDSLAASLLTYPAPAPN
jgi:CubicO group peptidase (beta-lactamase class C family)